MEDNAWALSKQLLCPTLHPCCNLQACLHSQSKLFKDLIKQINPLTRLLPRSCHSGGSLFSDFPEPGFCRVPFEMQEALQNDQIKYLL